MKIQIFVPGSKIFLKDELSWNELDDHLSCKNLNALHWWWWFGDFILESVLYKYEGLWVCVQYGCVWHYYVQKDFENY